jgi:hypothetical protein
MRFVPQRILRGLVTFERHIGTTVKRVIEGSWRSEEVQASFDDPLRPRA